MKKTKAARGATPSPVSIDDRVAYALAWLKKNGNEKARHELLPRYGITAKKTFGVSMANIQRLAKELGRGHDLAAALWQTGWYEARMMTAFVDEPDRVTPAQMDRWVRDFDNWAICDTLCFRLFDQTPHAFAKVKQWSASEDEFTKRTAFALLASLALHGKGEDKDFLAALPLIERAATDERNFVKKGVNWALRAIGGKRSPALRKAARDLAQTLAASPRSDGQMDRQGRPAQVRKIARTGRTTAPPLPSSRDTRTVTNLAREVDQ